MKIYSKIIVAIAALLLSQNALAKLSVFACEPEWAALARELGGDHLKITVATSGLQDPHHIQARPSLLARARARRADLLLCTGAELEIGWLPLLLQKTGNPKIQPGQPGNFMATDFVRLLDVPAKLDRSEGDIHAAGNPHIQTDPRRIGEVAKALAQRLRQIDPANADDYTSRFAAFDQRWRAAIGRWTKEAAPLRGKSIIVQHKSWVYLEDWLGLKELATLEVKPGVPATTSHLSRLLSLVKSTPVLAILHAAYQNPRSAQWLSDKSGIPALKMPFTVGGTKQAKDLFGLFDDTVDRLVGAIR